MDPFDGVGPALARLREARGLTQEEVARELGVRGTSVSRLEQKGANPRAESIGRYLKAIGCDANDFFRALLQVQSRLAPAAESEIREPTAEGDPLDDLADRFKREIDTFVDGLKARSPRR